MSEARDRHAQALGFLLQYYRVCEPGRTVETDSWYSQLTFYVPGFETAYTVHVFERTGLTADDPHHYRASWCSVLEWGVNAFHRARSAIDVLVQTVGPVRDLEARRAAARAEAERKKQERQDHHSRVTLLKLERDRLSRARDSLRLRTW